MSDDRPTCAREFTFDSEGIRLCGTIEGPSRQSASGSVLLLSGSGPQDRDETIAGKKPFRVLSRELASWGYQVFRWDDRGVAASEGDYPAASETSLVEDVRNAMRAITRESAIDRHILLGHSQGTLIAAAVAALRSPSVSGVVLLAGIGLPGRESLLDQHVRICRAEGWTDSDLAASLEQKERLFDLLLDAQSEIDAGAAPETILPVLRNALFDEFLGGFKRSDLHPDDWREIELAVDDLLEWEWRYLLGIDPAEHLSRLTCPVLAICGDQDAQVDAKRNLRAIEVACRNGRNPAIETHVLADYNHLFQKTSSPGLSEYESLGPPFDGKILTVIRDWLNRKSGTATCPPDRA